MDSDESTASGSRIRSLIYGKLIDKPYIILNMEICTVLLERQALFRRIPSLE